jgi:hypothetical protein
MTPIEKVMSRVEMTPECWLWTGARNHYGYGIINIQKKIHRVAYEHFLGPIPEALVIDHLCRVRHCVNPEHLEAVTFRENVLRGDSGPARNARKTHCDKGHPLTGDNLTIIEVGGRRSRRCRACVAEYMRLYWLARRTHANGSTSPGGGGGRGRPR